MYHLISDLISVHRHEGFNFAVGQAMARAGQIFADAWMTDSMYFFGRTPNSVPMVLYCVRFAPCLFFVLNACTGCCP